MSEISPAEGCLTVGELMIALVEFGNMEAPIVLLGEGWLKQAEDDLGAAVLLHPKPDEDTDGDRGSIESRCQSCRHWGRTDDPHEEVPAEFVGGPHHKPCMHPHVGGGCYNNSACKGPDGANSYHVISTGPSFGCVHFERAVAV